MDIKNKDKNQCGNVDDDSLVDILCVEGINAKGYGSIPKAVMKDKRLPIQAKAIYAYFCSYAGSGSRAFPGRRIILGDLMISKDYYYKNLKLLKDFDFIRVSQEQGKGGKYGRNIYTLVSCPRSQSVMFLPCPATQDTVEPPCPMPPDTVPQDTNINSTNNDIYLSINPKYIRTDKMDRMDDYSCLVKENIEYHALMEQEVNKDLVKSIFILLLDTLCSEEKTFKINGESMDAQLVKRRFMELKQADVSAVIVGIGKLTEPIRNPRNYLLTALYNAPATSETKWAAEIGSTIRKYRDGSR